MIAIDPLCFERSVLNTLIYHDYAWGDDHKFLLSFKADEKYFIHPFHKAIIKAIERLRERDYPIDEKFVKNELVLMNAYDDIAYNNVIAMMPLEVAHFKIYYKELVDTYNKNILRIVA